MECLDKREIKIYRWLDKLRDDWDVHNECVLYTHIAYFENHITIQLILQSYELHIFTLCRLQELFNNNNKKYSIIRYTLICSMNNFWKVTFHILNIVLTCVTNTQCVCTTYTLVRCTLYTLKCWFYRFYFFPQDVVYSPGMSNDLTFIYCQCIFNHCVDGLNYWLILTDQIDFTYVKKSEHTCVCTLYSVCAVYGAPGEAFDGRDRYQIIKIYYW